MMLVLALCVGMAPEVSTAIDHFTEMAGTRRRLAEALARRESMCNPSDVNQKTGAAGLFQIMPGTAAELLLGRKASKKKRRLLASTLLDPILNAHLAGQVFKKALHRCKGNESHALSVYNGQGKCQDSEFSFQVLRLAEEPAIS